MSVLTNTKIRITYPQHKAQLTVAKSQSKYPTRHTGRGRKHQISVARHTEVTVTPRHDVTTNDLLLATSHPEYPVQYQSQSLHRMHP